MAAPLPPEFHIFRNVFCALRFVEKDALIDAGVLVDVEDWKVFEEDPGLFLISIDDERKAALWRLLPPQSRSASV